MHRFGLVDEADETEEFWFKDPALRTQIPGMTAAAGGIDPVLARKIMAGNILIRIDTKAMGREDGPGLIFTKLLVSEPL